MSDVLIVYKTDDQQAAMEYIADNLTRPDLVLFDDSVPGQLGMSTNNPATHGEILAAMANS